MSTETDLRLTIGEEAAIGNSLESTIRFYRRRHSEAVRYKVDVYLSHLCRERVSIACRLIRNIRDRGLSWTEEGRR